MQWAGLLTTFTTKAWWGYCKVTGSFLTCLDLDSNPGRNDRLEAFSSNTLHMHWCLANSVLLWPSLLYEAAPKGTVRTEGSQIWVVGLLNSLLTNEVGNESPDWDLRKSGCLRFYSLIKEERRNQIYSIIRSWNSLLGINRRHLS